MRKLKAYLNGMADYRLSFRSYYNVHSVALAYQAGRDMAARLTRHRSA